MQIVILTINKAQYNVCEISDVTQAVPVDFSQDNSDVNLRLKVKNTKMG